MTAMKSLRCCSRRQWAGWRGCTPRDLLQLCGKAVKALEKTQEGLEEAGWESCIDTMVAECSVDGLGVLLAGSTQDRPTCGPAEQPTGLAKTRDCRQPGEDVGRL